MLGVLFGIFSLVAVGNISLALKQKVKETLDRFGPNLIIIRAGEVHITGRGMRQFAVAQTLKLKDVQAIKQFIRGVKQVVPVVEAMYPLRYRQNVTTMKVVGAPNQIAQVRNLALRQGRFYSQRDEIYLRKEVVLGFEAYKRLFGQGSAFGKFIFIRRVPCRVIGVLKKKGTDLAGDNLDEVVYLPLKTVMRRFLNQDYISAIYIQATSDKNLDILKADLKRLLRRQHGLTPLEKDDFSIYTLEDVTKTKQKGLKLVAVLSKMAATISFAIGGLGIFAMMLLAVTERQKEIGIRRAVGARKRDIIWQFLGEACLISLSGGILGTLGGVAIGLIASLIASLPFVLSLKLIFSGLFVSLFLGIGAGVYPAYLAAKLMPLEVLKR